MIRSVRVRRPGWLLVVAALFACDDPVGSRPSSGIPLPAPLGPAGFSTEMDPWQPDVQWSADGRTIYAVNRLFAGLPYGIVAIDVPSGHARAVVADDNVSYQVLRISGDGAFLFYSSQRARTAGSQPEVGYSISRVPTSGSGAQALVHGASHVFAISHDGRLLAWRSHTSDSTFVRDLVTGETRPIADAGDPLSISPDHATLLHSAAPTLRVTASAIVGGDSTTAHGRLLDARWGAAGAELLFRGSEGRLLVQRGMAAAQQILWAPGPSHGFYNVHAATWSPDGTRVAASLGAGCITAPCRRLLVLIDAATGTSRILMDGPAPLLGRAIFSPDGQQIVVTAGGRLHVIGVR
jgi:hypothetical protein